MKKYMMLFIMVILLACASVATPVVIPTPTAVIPTATVVTPTLPPTQTLEPYEQYTIEYLRQRPYGGGRIEILEKILETDLFTSYRIRYPSDGLQIYGFVNIPKGTGPFPVIVSVHGYAPYGTYDVFDPAQDFADYFAANQFIVLHPGLRNHPPSDGGENLLRVGMSVDVLNLIALVKTQGNLPAELATADPARLGLYGMSLGGEIALRVMTVNPDIKATVLYSPMSGDIDRNSKQLYDVIGNEEFQLDTQIPLQMFDRISPKYYYHQITSVIQLHHGTADTTAPISWAVETCQFLEAAGKSVQCIYYPEAKHVFNRSNFEKLQASALEFYRLHLTP